MKHALKGLDVKFGQGIEGLQAHWTEIVGKDLLGQTQPRRLVKSRLGGGILELRVNGPSAVVVQHQAPDILARVNAFLGPAAVTALRIVQSPLRNAPNHATLASHGSARRYRSPLDAAIERELQRDLIAFADGPLKAALVKLGREALRGSRHD